MDASNPTPLPLKDQMNERPTVDHDAPRDFLLPHLQEDIHDLPLCSIRQRTDGGLSIGALVAESELEAHPMIAQNYPSLIEAMQLSRSRRKDSGVCPTSFSSDACAALGALGAEVRIDGARGLRSLAMSDLQNPRWTHAASEEGLLPGELVVSIELPPIGPARV